MHTTWSKRITPNSLILTPNSRLARFLRRYLSSNHSLNVWQSQPILPVQTWLNNVYRETLVWQENPLSLLSSNQEALLWQRIIERSSWGKELLQIPTTAKFVQQAYQTLCAWRLKLDALQQEYSPDHRAFLAWAQTFIDHCAHHRWLSQAQLIDYLLTAFEKNIVKPKQHILLFNFDEITPQLNHFFTVLPSFNTQIEWIEETKTKTTAKQVACNDLEDELFSMARWAKHCQQQFPDKTITCVVPNLTEIRPQVLKTFKHVFSPEALFDPEHRQEVVNISGGYSLANAPIIKSALHILHRNPYTIAIDEVTRLLTSPFLQGFSQECQQRASFDALLRECNQPQPTWKFIIYLANKNKHIPIFLQHIESWLNYYQTLPKKQSLQQWQEIFYQLLQQIGWGADRTLNSTEYQQVNRWYTLLHELASLGDDNETYTYSQALQLLQQLTQNTLFEIQSHDGPVQVLGLLEAAGSVSDYLWVMHLDDETLPQAAAPNPFLPYHMQHQYHMPHSSAERELNFSQRLIQRFHQSATDIIFSYHQHDADRQLSASPLLNDIPILSNAALKLAAYDSLPHSLLAKNHCEYIIDQQAPAIQTTETIKGGTGILKQQAACPFRAFAEYRLHAKGLNIPEHGLNALERGALLHTCLDRIWARLKTHAYLQRQTEAQLSKMLDELLNELFGQQQLTYLYKLKDRFKNLERQRLQQLLLTWLQLEKERPAFNVIAHEQWRQIQVGQLALHMQIDRIDELANGEKIVIDYKTGQVNPNDWFGSRPREPQLPLYTLSENEISGVAFAQVRIDAMKFKGIAANDVGIDGIKAIAQYKDEHIPPTWQALLEEWQHVMQKLATDFHSGVATVDPAYDTTCVYCELQSLCRIDEQYNA